MKKSRTTRDSMHFCQVHTQYIFYCNTFDFFHGTNRKNVLVKRFNKKIYLLRF